MSQRISNGHYKRSLVLNKQNIRNLRHRIPEATIRYRINHDLFTSTCIYHTYLGLKKNLVFASINPTFYEIMLDSISFLEESIAGPTCDIYMGEERDS